MTDSAAYLGSCETSMIELFCENKNRYLFLQRSSVGPQSASVMAGPNLDKSSVPLSDPTPFYENYTKLYFMQNTEKWV